MEKLNKKDLNAQVLELFLKIEKQFLSQTVIFIPEGYSCYSSDAVAVVGAAADLL